MAVAGTIVLLMGATQPHIQPRSHRQATGSLPPAAKSASEQKREPTTVIATYGRIWRSIPLSASHFPLCSQLE